jgi:molecular chaperone HtpG
MSTETLQFKTELKQVLDIIIHSLYSHKEIFLRELISNASDAIDTCRFQSLTKTELLEGDDAWKIKIIPDEKNRILTISDNGIGMSKESIVENLGTIARSGTKAFVENLKRAEVKDRPELIGQFGVGFYSSFMVADKVTVISRPAGGQSSDGVKWESDGQGDFTVESVDKPARGTDVTLHLREDASEFMQEWKLRDLVKQYSDFVEHPIVMDVTRDKEIKEETLNSRKAIWLRAKNEVDDKEYEAFYQHLSHDFEPPGKVIHYSAEGVIEFKALLFLPSHKTFDLMWGNDKKGLQLYIRRVFIMDDAEAMLPGYLRFIKGVVDSPDLPLNVSRELLQQSAPLEKIKSNLVNKVLRTLEEMKKDEYEAYLKFYKELGVFLKEGVYQDWSRREQLADLLLFESTRTEPCQLTTLEKYVAAMPENQKEIFFLFGESREAVEHSPLLESFKNKGQEVLFLIDAIDEFVAQALTEYKGKKLRAIDKGELGESASESIDEEKKTRFQPLLELLKEKLPDLKDVRLSRRLRDSAAVLVADEGAMGPHMERLLHRFGRANEIPPSKKILEVNPDHAAIDAINSLRIKDAKDGRLEQYAILLYEQALVAEGSRVKDPVAFARRINDLVVKDASK